jgi:flagellin-specific chaperone FliS
MPEKNSYIENEILNLSPVELILKIYDVAIVSCKRKNAEKANRAITELIASLNFDYKEISLSLFKLYHYCQYEIRQGNFDRAIEILKELRDAWATAFNLK